MGRAGDLLPFPLPLPLASLRGRAGGSVAAQQSTGCPLPLMGPSPLWGGEGAAVGRRSSSFLLL